MITKATIARIVLFVVVTVALVIYIGARFFGVFNFIGPHGYTVMLPIKESDGLFARSEVDYRGVNIGTLGTPQLTAAGVLVPLKIDGGSAPIPTNLHVVVADRTAVGERYVDLLPDTTSGPFLADGDRIPADRVTSPIPVQDVLLNLDQLVASVPNNDLRTVVHELGVGFNQLGPKLQLLLDSTNSLTKTAQSYLPQTLALIHDARTVLQTQNDLSDPIKSFSSDVHKVAEQLKDNDPDLRRLVRTGPQAGREVSALIDEAGDGLGDTIRQLLTLSQITRNHIRDVESVFQLYAGLVAAIPTILPGDDTAHLGLVLNVNDPPPCTRGYSATKVRPGTDTTEADPINYRAFCREPIFSPSNVRGFKPQYPFKDGRPQPPPPWFFAFYSDGTASGVFDPSGHRRGRSDNGRDGDFQGRDDHDRRHVERTSEFGSTMPGLLGAPASYGSFGLTPGLIPTG